MPVITTPGDKPRSRTRLAVLIMAGGVAVLGLLGTWIYGKVMGVIEALDCRESISVQATGESSEAASEAALALWREKVTGVHGPEAASSGIAFNSVKTCTGSGGSHTCVYRAEPCVWKK
jgi:hypothetical protein